MKNLIGFIGVLVIYALVNPISESFNSFSFWLYSGLLVSFWWCLIALPSALASMKMILFNAFLSFMSLYVYTRGINPFIDKEILLISSATFGILSYLSILFLNNKSKLNLGISYITYTLISILIVSIYINIQVNGLITKDTVYAIMQSNTGEALEFLLENLNHKSLIFTLFFSLTLLLFLNKVRTLDFDIIDVKNKNNYCFYFTLIRIFII